MPQLPAPYSAAHKALRAAVKVEQAKHARDLAHGMEEYAYKAKDGALAGDAAEIKIRATRRIGEINAAEKQAGLQAKGARGNPGGRGAKIVRGSQHPTQSLADRGVDKELAKRARALFAMPEPRFEREVIKVRRLASAAAEGDRAIVLAAKAERHAKAKARRTAREIDLADKIKALPTKRYGVVYADPEWRFETYSPKGKLDTSAENHYPTSELEAIKAREVPSISADDCVLFLWATVPMLPQALEVMAAWNFGYVSHCVWIKSKAGTGYWFRNKHELLLVGTRGNVVAPAQGTQWESVIEAPVGAHSEKPEIFYQLIESYFPNIPKVELNARKRRKGWDSWGTLELEAAE